MELSCSNTRKFLMFSLKKAFLIIPEMELFYISGSGNYERIPYIFLKETETETPKKFLKFQETELSYISGNGNPKKLFIFYKLTFRARRVDRTHS